MNKRMSLAISLFVIAVALFVVAANPVSAQQGINDMWNAVLMHSTLQVQGAVTHDSTLTQTGNATFSGTGTFAGALTASAGVTNTTFYQGAIQTASFAPNGDGAAQTLTPTKSTILLVPSGAVTLTLAVSGIPNGTRLTIVSDTAQNALFPDSGNQLLGGARTVAAGDVLDLIMIGAKWHEVAFVAN